MGINIKDTWFKGDRVLEALQKAENGEKYEIGHKMEVCDPAFFSCSSYVGQIIHDIKSDDDPDDRPPLLKNVWKLVDHRMIKLDPDAEFTSTSNSESYATFEVISDNYMEGANTVITTVNMHDIIHKESFGLLRAGKYVIDPDGYYGFVKGFEIKSVEDHKKMRDSKSNPHEFKVMKDMIMVEYDCEGEYSGRIEKGVFPKKETCELEKFLQKWVVIEEQTIYELEKKIKTIEENKNLDSYEDRLAITDGRDELANDTTALVSFNSKDQLENIHDKIAVKNNTAVVLQRSMKRVLKMKKEELELIMAAKRADLQAVMDNLNQAVKVFKRQMERINRLIVTLELYLGIKENIIQIAEGEPAPQDTVISLRQQMLYMDEEFGDPDNGGIDHNNIKEFEDWMIKTRAFEKIAPEKKCVVVMRPRRKMKNRGDLHPIIKAKLERLDCMVYIFIRNGDNVYRIWTDNLEFTDRLFPKRDELQGIVQEMFDAEKDRNDKDVDSYDYRKADERMNEAERVIFHYKRTMILLQGIIQRTQIFAPLPPMFNLLDVNTHDGVVEYVYDDERLLPDGRKRFKDWLLDINKEVKKGSRIIFGDAQGSANDWKERFSLRWDNDYSAPPMPQSGEYVVKGYKVPTWDWVYKRIPEEEYEADQKLKPEERKYSHTTGYRYFVQDENGETNTKKYEVEAYIRDENGERMRRDWIDHQLRISYNPQDVVYGKWGYQSHERKTNITFQIFPNSDTFFIHYDACSQEDIEFYINNRIDRQEYLNMMPILWTLKKRLKEEKEWENGFINAMSHELIYQFNLKEEFKEEIIEEINDAIKWWKDEVVKIWKRPISKDDIKSHRMIKDRVVSKIKKKLKLNVSVSNDKRALIFTYTPKTGVHKGKTHKFVVYGVFKKEFAENIKKYTDDKFWRDWNEKHISMAKIMREIAVLESGELFESAKKTKGVMEVVTTKLG